MDTIRLETVEVFTEYKSRCAQITSEYKELSEGKLEEDVCAAQLGKIGNGLSEMLATSVKKALRLERELEENTKFAADQMKESTKKAYQCAVEAEKNARKAKLIADKLASLAEKEVLHGEPLVERAKQVAENAKKCAEKAKHDAQQVQRNTEGAKVNTEKTTAMLSKPVLKMGIDIQFANMGMD